MKYYDAKGREHTARAGQTLPTGSMIMEGRNWRTLTAPETVRAVIIEGNPYEDEDDTVVLVPMTDEAWTARNAPKAPPPPLEGSYEAALAKAKAAVALLGAAPAGKRWVIVPTSWPKDGDFPYSQGRGVEALTIEQQDIPSPAPEASVATGGDYREQGDPRYPGKYDGQKAAREWAEDSYRSGDSWSDD